MHPLHDYVAKQLADKIKSRRVVIWYDDRGEFQPFVEEVRGGPRASSVPVAVEFGGSSARLAEYAGSMLELRAVVEPHVSDDTPASMVVYIPYVSRDRRASVLMELEKAGTTWEPQLKQLARNVLLQKYTVGVVDEMLPFDRKVSYEDLARAAGGDGAEPPSILKSIFHDTSGSDSLLAAWIMSDARDAEIMDKDAIPELMKLVKSRLGLDLPINSPLSKLRVVTLRYVLAGEFRLDLSCEPPASLDGVARPEGKDAESAVRELARRLRAAFPDAYSALADRVEAELGLKAEMVPPGALGAIDTFRFEEQALLRHAGDLIAAGKFNDALTLVVEREDSFWLDRDLSRKAQWEATRLMGELGTIAIQVRAAVSKTVGDAAVWLDAYVSKDGWYALDQAQRRLEAWVTNLDEELEERPIGVVRRAYDDACNAMAEGFTKALTKTGWSVAGRMHQTRIFSEVVSDQPKPVAYFLVDAMRFEMGVELAERLPKVSEVSVRAAVGSLPSITPIGMAALMPGASGSFSVAEQTGKFGALIDGTFLPDLAARRKFAAARIPKLVDVALDELLSLQPSRLARRLEHAQVIVVRSQEIDHAGEGRFTYQARQVMDTVIDNIARAIRKLSASGVEYCVVTADHGHLFLPSDRDESMRIDPPGGNTVDLHRRCWVGHGGTTPASCVRVSAAALGYASDLDFVFPIGPAVFKTGGDLAFHHGGPSLQELVVPVLTIRTKASGSPRLTVSPLTVEGTPPAVTNRIFSVVVQLGGQNLSLFANATLVRPLLVSEGKQVGSVGMAVGADLDRGTGFLSLPANAPVTIAFLLNDETVPSLRIVVQDASTDAELYRSPADIPVRLGV
jgi:hypothetical protein